MAESTSEINAKYNPMIERVRLEGDAELVECLEEERDEKILAVEVEAGEAETDRMLLSMAKGLMWGHWN